MDHNLAFACVGYGSAKALAALPGRRRYPVPAPDILDEQDPVGFCVTAMREAHPDWRIEPDAETRGAILERLRAEARRARSGLARRG